MSAPDKDCGSTYRVGRAGLSHFSPLNDCFVGAPSQDEWTSEAGRLQSPREWPILGLPTPGRPLTHGTVDACAQPSGQRQFEWILALTSEGHGCSY